MAARAVLSVAIGSIIGVITQYVVNASLAEISLNPAFSLAFGGCFIGLGVIILWRVLVPDTPMESTASLRLVMAVFAALVVLSGIFCVFVDKFWLQSLSWQAKIPMYTLLGASITYALCFSIMDLVNQGAPWCQCCHGGEEATTPVVSTPMQVFSLVAACCVSGCIYGYLFGTIDVEDDDAMHSRFKEQEYFCVPLGFVIGGLAGYSNDHHRRIQDVHFTYNLASPRTEWDFQDDAFGDDEAPCIDQCSTLME